MNPTLEPFKNIRPGQILTRNMEALNWSNKDLAESLGMSEETARFLVDGQRAVTSNTAILLGKAFGTSPEFWTNLERHYRDRQGKDTK